jgi:hypothetical protein
MTDRADEIAHKVIPAAGSEWPLSKHGRAIAVGHAANLIRAELAAAREADAHTIAVLEERLEAELAKLGRVSA